MIWHIRVWWDNGTIGTYEPGSIALDACRAWWRAEWLADDEGGLV